MSLDMPTDVTGKLGVTRHRRRPISPSLIAGGFMVAVVVVVGIVAAFWTPYSLESTGDGGRLTGPSADFWLGTDKLGRDLFSQFISGATSALIVAVFTIIIAGILGLILGVVAAATVWWLDAGVSKVIDIMIAFPTLLLAMLVVTVRGASLSSAILAIGIVASSNVVIPKIPVVYSAVLIFLGQMVTGLIIDALLLGFFDSYKVCGALLIAGGLLLNARIDAASNATA